MVVCRVISLSCRRLHAPTTFLNPLVNSPNKLIRSTVKCISTSQINFAGNVYLFYYLLLQVANVVNSFNVLF